MLRVGLTGGIGSGKTTAAHHFAQLGVHVIQADELGRTLMQPGQRVNAEIIRRFGPTVANADGTLDRHLLADLAFRQGRLLELTGIVHPAVHQAEEAWMEAISAADKSAIAMVESALIFEASRDGTIPGWRERFDRVVLVAAPDELKAERYAGRVAAHGHPATGKLFKSDWKPGSPVDRQEMERLIEEARMRLAAQIPDEEKAAQCDYVIDNTGTLEALRAAVEDVYAKLRVEAGWAS